MPFSFITDRIIEEKNKLIEEIESNGSYSFPPSDEFKKDDLFASKKGMMFAILTARDESGRETVIRAYSGEKDIKGYANPCYSRNEFKKVTEKWSAIIKNAPQSEIKFLTKEALTEIYSLYSFTDAWKNEFSLSDVFSSFAPSGSGDCAGIKCLNAAFRKNLRITGFGEFYYGKDTETRKSGAFYPPCRERCEKIIKRMTGLSFIYVDQDIAVINKQSGLLSVPGIGEEKLDSASERIKRVLYTDLKSPFVHRLDMDTSGILVFALNKDAHRNLSRQFENRTIRKEYTALLEGKIEKKSGRISLPHRLDTERRPYQVVDYENGKESITDYEILSWESRNSMPVTRVRFLPHTGRTHQIRVHSAYALGHPILGERLYADEKKGERLFLHASKITFIHPRSGKEITIISDPDF